MSVTGSPSLAPWPESLPALLKRYGPDVRHALAGAIPARLQRLLSLDDVLQQTYIDALLDFGGFVERDDDAFRRWLVTLARRNVQDAVRMLEADKRGGAHSPVPGDSQELIDELAPRSDSTPSRHAARREASEALQRAIDDLPQPYRQVVQLYDIDRQPIEQVAARLERSAGAVYMLRARAHRWLRELLGSSSRYFSTSA